MNFSILWKNFVGMTAKMKEASERGVLVFNPVVDGHPTKAGASIIGEVTANALQCAGSH